MIFTAWKISFYLDTICLIRFPKVLICIEICSPPMIKSSSSDLFWERARERRYFHVAVNFTTTHSFLSLVSLLPISLFVCTSLYTCGTIWTCSTLVYVRYVCTVSSSSVSRYLRWRYPFPPFHARVRRACTWCTWYTRSETAPCYGTN